MDIVLPDLIMKIFRLPFSVVGRFPPRTTFCQPEMAKMVKNQTLSNTGEINKSEFRKTVVIKIPGGAMSNITTVRVEHADIFRIGRIDQIPIFLIAAGSILLLILIIRSYKQVFP